MLFMLPLSCHSVQNIFTRNPDKGIRSHKKSKCKGIHSLETLPLSQYFSEHVSLFTVEGQVSAVSSTVVNGS
jgi:hypothetical protein